MEEHLTRLAELRVRHHQHAGVQMDPVTIKITGLGRAHPGHRQQADQRLPGRGPQRRLEPARSADQRGDLAG
jgi:hypothetical protein